MFFVPRLMHDYYREVSIPDIPFDSLDPDDAALGRHLVVLAYTLQWFERAATGRGDHA